MAVSQELLATLREQLAAAGARLVFAQKVVKCVTSTGKRAPKATGKERVMALTAEPRVNRRGLKGMLHSCKLSQGRLQVRQSWRLKLVVAIEVLGEQATGRPCLQLTLAGGTLSKEEKLAFELLGPSSAALDFLGTLIAFFRQYEESPPHVTGHDAGALEYWMQTSQHAALEGLSGSDGLGSKASSHAAGAHAASKQERELAELLDRFALDLGDTQHFSIRLQDELAALEDANVQTMVGGAMDATSLISRVEDSYALVDDLDENLSILDLKLRHMRADIAAFEARSKALQVAKDNQNTLGEVLEKLLRQLRLAPASSRILAAPSFAPSVYEASIQAGWDLVKVLRAVDDNLRPSMSLASAGSATGSLTLGTLSKQQQHPPLPEDLDLTSGSPLGAISAVGQQRSRLQAAAQLYNNAARAHITAQLAALTEAAAMGSGRLDGGLRSLSPPDMSGVHAELNAARRLLQILMRQRPVDHIPQAASCIALDIVTCISCMGKVMVALHGPGGRQQVLAACAAVNTVLQRHLQRAAAALKRSVASQASSGADLGMSHLAKQEDFLPQREADSAVYRVQQVLSAWIPCLAAELEFCSTLVDSCQQPGGAALQSGNSWQMESRADIMSTDAMASVLQGLDKDFWDMAEAACKCYPLASLALLSNVARWKHRALNNSAPLTALLQDLSARLTQSFYGSLRTLAASVERYDSRNAVGISEAVKWQHVLPFLPALTAFVAACEQAVADAESGLAAARGPKAATRPGSSAAADDGFSADELFSPAAKGTPAAQLLSRLPAPASSPAARRVAEASYAFLGTVCLGTLDRLSTSDTKHGARLKLENLAYLDEWLQSTVKLSAAQAAASVVLQAMQAHVASGKEASANVYIKQQLDHAKLLQLDAFAQRLDEYMASGGSAEQAPGHMNTQAAEFKALVASLSGPEKKVAAMHARLLKHFGGAATAPIVHWVWNLLSRRLNTRYSALARHAARVYPAVQLPVSPGHLQELLVLVPG